MDANAARSILSSLDPLLDTEENGYALLSAGRSADVVRELLLKLIDEWRNYNLQEAASRVWVDTLTCNSNVLKEAGIFAQDNFERLIATCRDAGDAVASKVTEGLLSLIRARIYDKENAAVVEFAGPKAAFMAQVVKKLHDVGLLTPKSKAALVNSGRHAYPIAKCLFALSYEGLLTTDNFDIVVGAKVHANVLRRALISLNKLKLLDQVNVDMLVAAGDQAGVEAEKIISQHNNKMLAQVAGFIISAMGIAAAVIAFVLLNAGTLGIPGFILLVITGYVFASFGIVGIASTLEGTGFFATKAPETNEAVTNKVTPRLNDLLQVHAEPEKMILSSKVWAMDSGIGIPKAGFFTTKANDPSVNELLSDNLKPSSQSNYFLYPNRT